MSLMDAYPPCLQYERPFDPTEEISEDADNLIVVTYEDNDHSRKRKIRKFRGRSVEELLFTHETFVAMMTSMMLEEDQWRIEWKNSMSLSPMKKWDIVLDENPNVPETAAGFKTLIKAMVKKMVIDADPKGTLMKAFVRGLFNKEKDIQVDDHHERIEQIFTYMEMIPGEQDHNLTDHQRNSYFLETFPVAWQRAFNASSVKLADTSTEEIRDYMIIQKLEADQQAKKTSKSVSFSAKSDRNNNGNGRGGRGRGGRGRGGRGRGRGGRGGRGTPCPRHPNGRHTDAECRLNPHNGSNAPYPMHYGGPRQFGGRGFGGRGRGRGRGEQYHMQYHPAGVPSMPPFEQYMTQQQQRPQPQSQQQQPPQQQHGYDAYANIGSFQGYQGGHWNPYTNQWE